MLHDLDGVSLALFGSGAASAGEMSENFAAMSIAAPASAVITDEPRFGGGGAESGVKQCRHPCIPGQRRPAAEDDGDEPAPIPPDRSRQIEPGRTGESGFNPVHARIARHQVVVIEIGMSLLAKPLDRKVVVIFREIS
jgi:hypothetical protein